MKKEFYAYEGRMVIQTNNGLFVCDVEKNGDFLLKFALGMGDKSNLVIPNEVKISNPRGLNIIEVSAFELESPRNAYFVKNGVLYGRYKMDPSDKDEKPVTALIAYPRGKTDSIFVLPDEVNAIYQKRNSVNSYTGIELNPNLNVIVGNVEIPSLAHGRPIGNAVFLNKAELLQNAIYQNGNNAFELDKKTSDILTKNFAAEDFLAINANLKNYLSSQKTEDLHANQSPKEE